MSKENVIIASKKEIEALGKKLAAVQDALNKVVETFAQVAGDAPATLKKKKTKTKAKVVTPAQEVQTAAQTQPAVQAVASATPVKAAPAKAIATKAPPKLTKLPAKSKGNGSLPSMPGH